MIRKKVISTVCSGVFFFFLSAQNSFALSETDACAIISNYNTGDSITDEVKSAGVFLKSLKEPCEGNEEIAEKLRNICPTVFCGKGLREGLDATKPSLQGTGISTADSIIRVILGLVNFALPFAGLFAFVGLIYGGFLYLSSFAEDQTEKAKNILMWSALGLLVIFIAYPFVSTLIRLE
ncbi:hypothetical protein HON22_01545 [Candidatus Peregrinibacteria bacterium]|jgi:hypothetical protein|nr:hypothetical protein [Candidatus Peregrinibacteria bacterium]